MRVEESTTTEQMRTAEVIASLCLATDLAMTLPLEQGLHSTLVAMRLADRLGVDRETASQTYYACLLFYAGCTADAETTVAIFRDPGALTKHFTPAMLGEPMEVMVGIARALAEPGGSRTASTMRVIRGLPRAVRGHREHLAALCEVAQMLTDRLGLPAAIRGLLRAVGKG